MSLPECLRQLGYREFTSLQKESFKKIVRERSNVIVVAPTGSGKTEAAVIPVFYVLSRLNAKPISCVYITPLRALNRDIVNRISRLAGCFNVTVALRHGDTPYSARKAIQKSPPQVLVTTPETFTYVLLNAELLRQLSNLRFVILDELHELVESKRGLLLLTTLYLVVNHLRIRPVVIGLSATVSNENAVSELISSINRLPTEVVKDTGGKELEISVEAPSCDDECREAVGGTVDERVAGRAYYIIRKINESRSVLVFTNTRTMAEYMSSLLKNLSERLGLDLQISVHHGSLSKEHREEVERRFRSGEIKAVVATSSLELGIDIGSVDYVIQYLSPRQVTRLVQRIGRSGHRLGGVSKGSIVSTSNLLHYLESVVIARRALAGELEKETIHDSPLDVLSYSIAVYTLINPHGVDVNRLYASIVQNALYKNLSFQDFMDVVSYLDYSRIVKLESGLLKPTRKTRLHVYKTSMIPSTREITVVDVASSNRVGSLDEDYVILNVQQGDYLVLAGSVWRVVSYAESEGRLYVERAEAPSEEAVIPSWEGENIPVEYKVAREVGSVIRRLKEGRIEGARREYGLKIDVTTRGLDLFGDDKTIVVDYVKPLRAIIINVFGGSKVNSMLKDLLHYYVKRIYPLGNIKTYSTPYAVVLRASNVDPELLRENVVKFFNSLDKFVEESFLQNAAQESKTLLWRIYQVAQRFGAISPEAERVSNAMLQAFVDTVIGREAFKEVLTRDYDITSARELARLVVTGVVKVVDRVSENLSDFHKEVLEYIEVPLVRGLVFDQEAYLAKLLSRKVTLLCLSCGYHESGSVADFLKWSGFGCPKCGRATLTLVKGHNISNELEIVKKLKNKLKLTDEENKILDELSRRAVLLYRFKRDALLALSARGVGSAEAVKILNNVMRGRDLVQEIYESEKKFLMVKELIRRD
ncbi:DEAD/DEAH box helicase domain protein [Thermogladius calderae 1633]|uniref:DEAD/DEAH box helicase domain protein n=1 Tax=Thermogladius calderae (strain DSM 22663 / VKM B-2946 / 1633) TaxID=1184251 RepID=I3TDA3_THEC1|nr:DEAD/DEAH box helicase [Thermogladius calderae]AFK50741.1 DEAD/DEAH box helicase domain protein [Thermogladius calderae 1633]